MEEKIKQMKNENNNNSNNNNQKNIKARKVFLQIVIVVFSLTVLILSLITLASTVKAQGNLAFGRYRFYIMRAESQPNIAKVGDLVIAQKLDAGQLKVGDNIVYGGKEVYYCDNIVQIKKTNIVNKLITAENNGISYQFDETEISGKVVKVIPKLGNIIAFLRTPVGIVFFILFVICLFALLRILITYNKDDDKQENKIENEKAK